MTEVTPLHALLASISDSITRQQEGDAPVYAVHFNNHDLDFLIRTMRPDGKKKKKKQQKDSELANFFDLQKPLPLADKESAGMLFAIQVVSDNSIQSGRYQLRFRHGSTKGVTTSTFDMDGIRAMFPDERLSVDPPSISTPELNAE